MERGLTRTEIEKAVDNMGCDEIALIISSREADLSRLTDNVKTLQLENSDLIKKNDSAVRERDNYQRLWSDEKKSHSHASGEASAYLEVIEKLIEKLKG